MMFPGCIPACWLVTAKIDSSSPAPRTLTLNKQQLTENGSMIWQMRRLIAFAKGSHESKHHNTDNTVM